jgi:CheY-like chemotaxis protein
MAEREGQARLKILVVDDHVEIAQLFAELLGQLGHDADLCHDGDTAIAKVAAARPDVVFLDLGLPPSDGYSIARQLSRADRPPLVVAISGRRPDDDRSRAAGIAHYLLKPFTAESVLDILTRCGPSRSS